MPDIHRTELTVDAGVIDVNRHVNNLAYLGWMQEVAIAHSAAQGWPMARYLEAGAGWVVRSHQIEYLRPAFLGEVLTLLTWVADFRPRASRRRYLFWRAADRRRVATAETDWVFVDLATGRPAPIPAALAGAFVVVPDGTDVLGALGLGSGDGAAKQKR